MCPSVEMALKAEKLFQIQNQCFHTAVVFCVKCGPDCCWSMFLHIADITMPVQEKVWKPLSSWLLAHYQHHLLSIVLAAFVRCSVCLIVVWEGSWQSWLLFFCYAASFLSVAVLPGSFEDCGKSYTRPNPANVPSSFNFISSSGLSLNLSARLVVTCKPAIFLSRHQPGPPPLPGQQSNRGRLRSCICPQHQPRLLTSALWVCQRTGIRVRLSDRLLFQGLSSNGS